ncbi:MAG: thioredoxin-related protein [Arenicella sp.]|jgi:thioredoxin-related protein
MMKRNRKIVLTDFPIGIRFKRPRLNLISLVTQCQKLLVLSFILILFSIQTQAQSKKVNWLSFEQLTDSIRSNPKPILVFIHTDWCKFCKMQGKNTFGNSDLAEALSQDYYALQLNAENESDLKFLNRVYKSNPNAYHELANFLGKENGELVFPITVLLNQNFQLKKRLVGFINSEDLLKEL